MTATTMALPARPRALRRSAKVCKTGLKRMAVKAGMNRAERSEAEPVREMVGRLWMEEPDR